VFADIDPDETAEWRSALDSVLRFNGRERAEFLIAELTDGRVQWSAVEENLRKFPGQEKR